MLPNPVLKNMTANDLGQRYSETYIAYGGEIVYCRAFDGHAIYYKKQDRKDVEEAFKWDKLDTARPLSQWYITKDGSQYLQYFTTKQYSRGFSRNTCSFFVPSTADVAPGYNNLTACFFNKPPKRPMYRLDVKSLQGQIEEGKTIQLNPMILVTPGYILFRKTVIGEFKDAQFNLWRPEFSEEIMELVENPVINNHEHLHRKTIEPKITFNNLNIIFDDIENFREIREEIRPYNRQDAPNAFSVVYDRDAIIPNEETKQLFYKLVYGSRARAQREASMFKKSFVWLQHETDLWRIGFNP